MGIARALSGEDARLRVGVVLDRAVLVEVIGRDVEQHRHAGMEGALHAQLERRAFYDQDLVLLAGGLGERTPDVPAGDRVDPPGAQARLDHARRGRLPVRAGHREVRHPGDPSAELHLAPHRQTSLPSPGEDRRPDRDARPGHDERRPVEV
jgi:hypothetical protein